MLKEEAVIQTESADARAKEALRQKQQMFAQAKQMQTMLIALQEQMQCQPVAAAAAASAQRLQKREFFTMQSKANAEFNSALQDLQLQTPIQAQSD